MTLLSLKINFDNNYYGCHEFHQLMPYTEYIPDGRSMLCRISKLGNVIEFFPTLIPTTSAPGEITFNSTSGCLKMYNYIY